MSSPTPTSDPMAIMASAIAKAVMQELLPVLTQILESSSAPAVEPRLTTDELATILKIHPGTARDWAKQGCPHLIVARGAHRFLLSEVEGWLKSRDKNQ